MAWRVLYLVDSLGMGGAERGLSLTVRHLDRTCVEPEVAYLFEPSPVAAEIKAADVRVHRLRARPGPRALVAIPRVRRLLKQGRFDAIHTQVVWASIVGRIAGRLAGVKVISHIANVPAAGFMERELSGSVARKSRLVARLDEWTGGRFVDRFVAISEAVRADPIRGASWDRSKIDVVLRGQELAELRVRSKGPVNPPIDDRGDPCIVAVGRLSEQKGHRFLIDAMHDVVKVFPRTRLLLCGDGHLRARLGRQAAPLGERVAFLGIRADVPAIVALADVFVFPSLWEGQGSALLEAMAIGAPIVATTVPSTVETLRHGEECWLAPPGDGAALADGIIKLLRDRDLADRIAAAGAKRAEDFDIDKTTRDLEAVYARVLD